MADPSETPVTVTQADSAPKGKSVSSSKTRKRCPACNEDCPVAVKKCRNRECDYTFEKKKKDWERVKKRGVISPTHEREKLEYRADCLHEGCDYDVVVLYHCKHAKGNSIFPYATPGKAFEFLGDGSKEHPPSDEGRFFLQMFSQFFLGHPHGMPKWTHKKKGKNAQSSSSTTSAEPASKTEGKNDHSSSSTTSAEPASQTEGKNAQSSSSTTSAQPALQTEVNAGKNAQSCSSTTSAPPASQTEGKNAQSCTSATSQPASQTEGKNAQSCTSAKSQPASQTEGPTVVIYRQDDLNVAVGYLHSGRRMLHGKQVPSGYDVVQLTWVREGEVLAPVLLGDVEENRVLASGRFFALPRSHLSKVKLAP